jgi:serine/threonine protein kinase
MSQVYLAERVNMGKQVAVKFLRSAFANLPGFVKRFEREAQACSRLNHLNLVSVVDFGVAFRLPYLVMEYVGGVTLAEAIANGPMDTTRAIRILKQMLSGLQHAHSRGVVHRDLKPANVMLMEMTGTEDFVKIMDFGTAQVLTGEEEGQRHSGTDIGTPWYMAPEQAAGQRTDARTDLYALGVIMFEMLTGKRPYLAENPIRVLQMHLQSPIPSLRALCPERGFSPELEGVIVRAMKKQANERFEGAAAFSAALDELPEAKRALFLTGPMSVAEEDIEQAGPPTAEVSVSSARAANASASDPLVQLIRQSEADFETAPFERTEPKKGGKAALVTLVLLLMAGGLGVTLFLLLR